MKIEWIVEPVFWHEALQRIRGDEIDCVEFAGRFEPCPKPFKSWVEFRAYVEYERNEASLNALRGLRESYFSGNTGADIDAIYQSARFGVRALPVITDSRTHYFVDTVL